MVRSKPAPARATYRIRFPNHGLASSLWFGETGRKLGHSQNQIRTNASELGHHPRE